MRRAFPKCQALGDVIQRGFGRIWSVGILWLRAVLQGQLHLRAVLQGQLHLRAWLSCRASWTCGLSYRASWTCTVLQGQLDLHCLAGPVGFALSCRASWTCRFALCGHTDLADATNPRRGQLTVQHVGLLTVQHVAPQVYSDSCI